ncbi:MAG: hypothetical protein H7282_02620 [Cytophagaceae bacterium]|nr:hypothetical protein [Cytophagaceae bacterium]
MKQTLFILLSSSLLLLACSKKDDPTPAATDPNYPTTQWISVKQNQNDTAEASNGYLYLNSTYSSTGARGTGVTTVKKIKGDFEMKVKFSSFKPTGSNTISELFGCILSSTSPKTSNGILSLLLSKNTMYVEDSNVVNTISKPTANRQGEWYVKRTGGDYTSWFRIGSDTLKMNKTNYITSDLSMSCTIVAFDNTVTSSSVHIDDFTLTGGGGDVKSDPFDTNDITNIPQP